MKKTLSAVLGLAMIGSAPAENVTDIDRLVCSAGQAHICLETGDCYRASPFQLGMPEFVVIDTKKPTISTTRTSGQDRSSKFASYERADGLIQLQGAEHGRAFSFVIHEETGLLTASIARDGMSISVFGACTAADL